MDFTSAVNNRQLISFVYDGHPRIVQPATYGVTSTGKESLRACQVDGTSRRNIVPCWELYTVAKMANVAPVGQAFEEFAVEGYTRGDSAFTQIVAEH